MNTITFSEKLLYSFYHLIPVQLSISILFPLKQFNYTKPNLDKEKLSVNNKRSAEVRKYGIV